MTSMPELVAMLHSFVGAAAVLVGIATYLQPGGADAAGPTPRTWSRSTSACCVGAVTFSGSVVAFGKLRGIDRQPSRCCCRAATCSTSSR